MIIGGSCHAFVGGLILRVSNHSLCRRATSNRCDLQQDTGMNSMTRTRKASLTMVTLALWLFAQTTHAEYTFTTLDYPSAANWTNAVGISGNNIVGCYKDASAKFHGFIYDGSSYTTLDVPGSGGTLACGISGNNIVGYYYGIQNRMHGFVYDGSSFTTLDYPSAVTTSGTMAMGIFGSTIVGSYYDSANKMHGFIYDGSSYTTLDNPAALGRNASGTFVTGISGSTIVGYYYPSEGPYGFVYNGSSYVTLPAPSDGYAGALWATGVSGSTIVGGYYANGYARGFIYDGSSYTAIDHPSGVKGTAANSISGGNIVGYYYDSSHYKHGFLASVPEPSSLALLIIAATALLGYIWHGRKRTA
jgi:hypothetical protein